MADSISHAAKLLKRAALIDPFAWQTPLTKRYQKRRNLSYEAALKEAAFHGHVPFVDDQGGDTMATTDWAAVGAYDHNWTHPDYKVPPPPLPDEPEF